MYKKSTLFFLLLILPSTIAMAQSNENQISEAILKGSISQQNFSEFDINKDGQIDVTDLVKIAKPDMFPKSLTGHTWLVAASFTASEGNMIPVSYSFAISIYEDKSIVSLITGSNPSKGILQQSSKDQSQQNGWQRPVYALSGMIPPGTSFTASIDNAAITRIESPNCQISPENDNNPTGKSLSKEWIIEIDKTALYAGAVSHGKIIENTTGIFEDKVVSSVGRIYMVPYAPASSDETNIR
jgi:hypothetical protein